MNMDKFGEEAVTFDENDPFRPTNMEVAVTAIITAKYEEDWFKEARAKPSVTLYTIPGKELNEIRQTVVSSLSDSSANSSLKLRLVLAYFYAVLPTIKNKLPADWTSFEIPLGKKGDSLTPLDLVRVTTETLSSVVMSAATVTARDDRWLLLLLLAPYRVTSASVGKHKDGLIRQITEKIKSLGCTTPTLISNVLTEGDFWFNNKDYVKIVAVVDMYFIRFSQDPRSVMRISTLGTRFRGCSTLTAWNDMCKSLNLESEDAAEWLWTEALCREYKNINKKGQEMDNMYSYAPYFMSLGLSEKSPYSTSYNPNLHYFIHAVGCALGNAKSINARFIEKGHCISTRGNALIFSFVMLEKHKWNTTEAVERGRASDENKVVGVEDYPKINSAIEWVIYMQSGITPKVIQDRVREQWRSLKNSPQGTMGRFLSQILPA